MQIASYDWEGETLGPDDTIQEAARSMRTRISDRCLSQRTTVWSAT